MVGAIAHFIVREPSPILVLMPTESDCRGLMVDDIEGLFAESPALTDKLPMPSPGRSDRNTLVHRLFKGGSLKIVAAGAPRNMRRHSARILAIDEIDACQATAEGDAPSLAMQRTLTWPNRKVICGGTPLDASTSNITRLYAQSDQRIWEVPCVHCREFAEIVWEAITWPEGRPQEAAWTCPNCGGSVADKHKVEMSRRGRWRALRPEAGPTHVGFAINALASLLPNATWPKLAEEYDKAKHDVTTLRVFWNTTLGRPWSEEADEVDERALAARAEPFSLDAMPAEVLALTAGVDCQDDRLEIVITGWSRSGVCFVLDHQVIWGAIGDEFTWRSLDELLRIRWAHPHGGRLGIDALCIDGGDGGHLDLVMAFCAPRASRRVMCIKGAPGFARPAILASKSRMKGGGRLWIVGSDSLKARIFNQLQRGSSIRFSDALEPVFYEQLASERRVVRIVRGKPTARFERIKGASAECLDGLAYAFAAKTALGLNDGAFNLREDQVRTTAPPKEVPTVVRSDWMRKQHRSWDDGEWGR